MNPLRLSLAFLALAAVGAAAPAPVPSPAPPPPEPPARKESSSEWVFSLLPKSFQKNPLLELTVITEMTEAGRRLPPVSTAQPAYFELFTTGAHHQGHAQGSGATLKMEDVQRLLIRSLTTNGYRPAQPPAQPPKGEPTNAKEAAAQKAAADKKLEEEYQALAAKVPPEQQAWG